MLRERLLKRGNYYVSTAVLNGRRYLRLTLNNPAHGVYAIGSAALTLSNGEGCGLIAPFDLSTLPGGDADNLCILFDWRH